MAGAKVNTGRLDWGLTPKRRYLCSLKFCDFLKRIEHTELRFCIWSSLVLCSAFPSIPWGVGKSRLWRSDTILLLPGSSVLYEVKWNQGVYWGFLVWFDLVFVFLKLTIYRLGWPWAHSSPGCGPCDPPRASACWVIGSQTRATTPGVDTLRLFRSLPQPARTVHCSAV